MFFPGRMGENLRRRTSAATACGWTSDNAAIPKNIWARFSFVRTTRQ